MSRTVLRLEPVFKERIWGGERLHTVFGYSIPGPDTGECWAISAHPGGPCAVMNSEFAGETLDSLWSSRRDLFGNAEGDVFPLLIKIIDAKDDLSIQVHPDDEYAGKHENGQLGKTECWYVLDCDEDASIVIGHNARTREEMSEMIADGRWDELIRQVPIRKGDFFQINPGCLHAIKGGTLILETQQSSDLTYRFYDYGRLQNGKPRQLHIEQCLAVTAVPFVPDAQERETVKRDDAEITRLVKCSYYSVYHGKVNGKAVFNWDEPFVNLSVIGGEGRLDGMEVRKGDHLVICADYGKMDVEGDLEFIYSHI